MKIYQNHLLQDPPGPCSLITPTFNSLSEILGEDFDKISLRDESWSYFLKFCTFSEEFGTSKESEYHQQQI